MMRRSSALVLLLAAGTAACDDASTAPAAGGARIDVSVSGGIAAADYAYRVEGEAVTGVRCANLCGFAPGDTLLALTPAQRRAVDLAVDRSGLPLWTGPADAGAECCDQMHTSVTWSDEGRSRTFGGTSGLLPEPFRALVRTLGLLYRATPPVIVSQSGGLGGYRRDMLQLRDARVDGTTLQADVEWGGGCARHDVDAVAWTGWMESAPVQIGVALTHDAHGDSCKALVHRTLRFDLEPLREAYVQAYGSRPATLVLQLGSASGGVTRSVSFSF